MTKLSALGNKILLVELETGEKKTKHGLIIADDSTVSAGERGIRARWAKVWSVGPDQHDVKEGQWVLMEHGRWTLGQTLDLGEGEFRFWMADPDGMMLVSDEKPEGL